MKVRCYLGNSDLEQELRRWWNLIGGARRDRPDDLNTASVIKPSIYAGFKAMGKKFSRFFFTPSFTASTPQPGALNTYIDA